MSPRPFCARVALIATLVICLSATAAQADVFTGDLSSPGTTQALSPSIVSDKDDYQPGDLVTLTGSNWLPRSGSGESAGAVAGSSTSSQPSGSRMVSGNTSKKSQRRKRGMIPSLVAPMSRPRPGRTLEVESLNCQKKGRQVS